MNREGFFFHKINSIFCIYLQSLPKKHWQKIANGRRIPNKWPRIACTSSSNSYVYGRMYLLHDFFPLNNHNLNSNYCRTTTITLEFFVLLWLCRSKSLCIAVCLIFIHVIDNLSRFHISSVHTIPLWIVDDNFVDMMPFFYVYEPSEIICNIKTRIVECLSEAKWNSWKK